VLETGSQTRSRRTDFSQIDKTGDIQKVQPAITVMARRLDPKRSKMDKVELSSWQQTFQIIQQFTPRPNDIAGLIQEFLEELIPRCSLPNSQPQISTFLTQLVTIYQQAQVLPELSTALIATLPQILAPNISNYTADEWLALWQNLLGTEPALEMPLRLMNVAIAYKKQPAQQKRLWLGLAKEERSILNGALGLEES
jgi:hypothetical protein